MGQKYQSFVIFAEMRTGSNLLEATLNKIRNVFCFGEAFNPFIMGWLDNDEILGFTKASREEDPMALLRTICNRPGKLSGFRYFHDHDPRVLEAIIDDTSCAKIILTRNPLDCYVSTALAYKTNQWKLNQTEVPIDAQIDYDGTAFRRLTEEVAAFQSRVRHRLQSTGQTAFQIDYVDLNDEELMIGLLHWLGLEDMDRKPRVLDQVPQNPREMKDKVSNFQDMRRDLQTLDPFEIDRLPDFEVQRGPTAREFYTCEAGNGLIYMPIYSGALPPHLGWLSSLAPATNDHSQSKLRQWKRQHPGHRSYAILRHPVYRAWCAFEQLLANAEPELRQLMRDSFRVNLPPDSELDLITEAQAQQHFLEFVQFLGRNLKGQTSIQTPPHWATQTAVLSGYAQFSPPDLLLREDMLREDITHLCQRAGISETRLEALDSDIYPEFLLEKPVINAVRNVYNRDYIDFGFANRPD